MNILPLPALDGVAAVDWELAGNVSANLSVTRTLQREVLDGDHWVAQLRFPPNVDDEAGIVDAWQAQARRGDRWLYLSPPQNKLRGAWSLSDLVSNGTFLGGATTGWTGTGATLSVNARRLKVKNSGAAIGYARQTLTVTADVPYVLLVDLYPGNVEAWRIRLLDGADAEEHVSYYDQAGRVPIVHIPASTTLTVELGCNTAVAGDDVKFGNVTAARCLLVKDSLAIGNTLTVKGGPASTDAAIKAGQFVTIRLWNGWQMVKLVEDLDFDANGEGTMRFEAALRDGVLGGGPVIVHQPFARMVFSDPRAVASIRAPMIYESSIGVMEDVTPLDGEVPHDTDIIWEWDANSLSLAPTIGEGTPSVTSDAADNYYFDSDGVLKVAAANSAVFEFDPVRKFLKGQRIQRARTNLALHSEDLTNAAWVKTDSTITANQAVAPDGTMTMDLVTEGSAGNAAVQQNYTATADTHQVFVKFLKRGNHDWVRIAIFDTATSGNGVRAWLNLRTGAVGTVGTFGLGTVAQAFMYDAGGGVYLCILMGKVNNAATALTAQVFSAAGDASNTRVSGAARYEWGAQIEDNVPFWSSYIKTTTASVVRDADIDTLALNLIPGFTESEYTIEAEVLLDHVEASAAITRNIVALDDGTTNEFSRLRIDAPNDDVNANTVDGGVTQANFVGNAIASGVPMRAAYGCKANDFAYSTLGSAVATDASGTMPTVTTLRKGALTTTVSLFGYLRRLRIRKAKKPARQIRSLSA